MSATRQQQNPWLTDHVVFFAYRWLTWAIVAALSLWHGLPGMSGLLLVVTAMVNILAMLMSQAYVRAARRTPLLMTIDLVYTIVVLVAGEGWSAPYFALHATSSLVLPGLIFGSQGGFIAGWAFVALDQASHWAANMPPSRLIEQSDLTGWPLLATMMLVPPVCGWGLPRVVELARRLLNQRAERQTNQRRQTSRPDLARGAGGGGLARLPTFSRESEDRRSSLAREFPLAMPTTAVRPQEQSAEDLRRLLFAPFPLVDMDLPAVLELLVTRFGDHTGAVSRVALLGRVRATHHAPRGVLVRLAQEALLNVQQHAHAATLTLTLRYDATSVALLIQDDGVGLLDGTYERPGLHALRAMQYRLNELGGRLDVFETEGGGVTVRAMVPLE